MTISKTHPMREAEIAVIDFVNNDVNDYMDSETKERKEADAINNAAIAAETERATTAEKVNADAIAAETERATTAEKVNADAIAAETERATTAEKVNADAISVNADAISSEEARATQVETSLQSAINSEYSRALTAETTLTNLYGTLAAKFPITKDSLDSDLQSAVDFVNTLPTFEFGYSESITIPAASTVSVDITFDKVFNDTPQVFTEVMCNTLNNILVSHVTYVDTTKVTIKLYNGGTTEVQNLTVDYLALAGR